MPTDINVSQLIINKLTQAQYNEAKSTGNISEFELYFITDDAATPVEDVVAVHNESPDAHSDLFNSKQEKIIGTAGQFVGFDVNGNAVAQEVPASGVGKAVEGVVGAEIFNCYEVVAGGPPAANIASGQYSHAEGAITTASGSCAHAEGSGTVASRDFSHAEGYGAEATAHASHAEGSNTNAKGSDSHAEGFYSIAEGMGSHAEGHGTHSLGHYSHAEGRYTYAGSETQHVQGKYNIKDDDSTYAHIVGNGTSDGVRSNAHTLDWDGNAWFAGDVYVGSTSGTNKDEGSKKLQKEIIGTQGQVVGFDANGNAVAIDLDVSPTYIIDQNTGDQIKLWHGSTAEYEAIETKDPKTIYILDDKSDNFTADSIDYDNTNSGLEATNVQAAIDKLAVSKAVSSWNDLEDKPFGLISEPLEIDTSKISLDSAVKDSIGTYYFKISDLMPTIEETNGAVATFNGSLSELNHWYSYDGEMDVYSCFDGNAEIFVTFCDGAYIQINASTTIVFPTPGIYVSVAYHGISLSFPSFTPEVVKKIDQMYLPESLPPYTSEDEGKVLRIVNGAPAWVSLTNAKEVYF